MPSQDAVKPSSTKTVLSPSTKNSAAVKARKRARPPASISAIETPDMKARYGGTMGSTQGLRKEMIPAASATNMAGRRLASMRSIPNICLR